ncbi:hypothetical protein MMC14_007857 [Varicellaria rhodocarpa]|nr:hypothetical protein [Varicellaria rhodocarpa]
MGSLPLKIRLDLRDHWEKIDSPVQKAISELYNLIGVPVAITLETPVIWAELQRYFPNHATFIPSIVDTTKTWIKCLTVKLEDDTHPDWTDRFLDEVKESGQALKVRILTQPGSQLGTAWEKRTSSFVIFIPQSSPPYQDAAQTSFTTDLDKLFSPISSEKKETDVINAEGLSRIYGASDPPIQSGRALASHLKSLPALDTLHGPHVLFPQQTPYHITVRSSKTTINIQGSHQPSLELLANYLKKWINTRMVDFRKLPALQVELQESHFGSGVFFDSLIIKPSDERQTILNVNPILVVAFIEGILGYHLIPQAKGIDDWYFRRDEKFE